MIVVEQKNGFIHTFSDQNKMIKKVLSNEMYDEAFDVLSYDYEETEVPITKLNIDQ